MLLKSVESGKGASNKNRFFSSVKQPELLEWPVGANLGSLKE